MNVFTKIGIHLALLGVAAGALAQAPAEPKAIGLGDKAPALKPARWIKGEPVRLGDGKVHVVEFWATWCGPCKVSIPHLTELQKKYKDRVTITGVSIWEVRPGGEDTSYLDQVAAFVEEMGERMDYRVAADGPEGTIATEWMQAAGQNGIPAAFVVGGDGTILWIGHPMADLEKVLDQVLDGTYDLAATKERIEREQRMEREMEELIGPVRDAFQTGDHRKVVETIDAVLVKRPDLVSMLGGPRFQAMVNYDVKAAQAYAQRLAAETYGDNPMALNNLAWTLVDPERKLEGVDYKGVVTIAERAAELTKHEDPNILDTLALAHFRAGNRAKAIELQEKAVELAAKDRSFDAEMLKELRERLEEFRRAQ
jgi:thiol-disulfide isomerase/thioredoxin